MDISDSEDDTHEPNTQEMTLSSDNDCNSKNNYKILHDIKQLGCTKKSLNMAAYRTYLDLCEVRKYEQVSYHYLPELDLIYLKTKKNDETEEEIVVPVLSSKKICFKLIEDYQEAFKSSYINLAICDNNSLIMYYKITKS